MHFVRFVDQVIYLFEMWIILYLYWGVVKLYYIILYYGL